VVRACSIPQDYDQSDVYAAHVTGKSPHGTAMSANVAVPSPPVFGTPLRKAASPPSPTASTHKETLGPRITFRDTASSSGSSSPLGPAELDMHGGGGDGHEDVVPSSSNQHSEARRRRDEGSQRSSSARDHLHDDGSSNHGASPEGSTPAPRRDAQHDVDMYAAEHVSGSNFGPGAHDRDSSVSADVPPERVDPQSRVTTSGSAGHHDKPTARSQRGGSGDARSARSAGHVDESMDELEGDAGAGGSQSRHSGKSSSSKQEGSKPKQAHGGAPGEGSGSRNSARHSDQRFSLRLPTADEILDDVLDAPAAAAAAAAAAAEVVDAGAQQSDPGASPGKETWDAAAGSRSVWDSVRAMSCLRADAEPHNPHALDEQKGGKPTTVMSRRTRVQSDASSLGVVPVANDGNSAGNNTLRHGERVPDEEYSMRRLRQRVFSMMPLFAQKWVVAMHRMYTIVARKAGPVLSPYRRFLRAVVRSSVFGTLVNICVIANVCVMAFRTFPAPLDVAKSISDADTAFTIVFFVEMGIKIFSFGGKMYVSSRWNIFDGFISSICMLAAVIESASRMPLPAVTVLRAFRILRIIRLMRGTEILKTYIFAISLSAVAITNIVAVIVLFFLMFTSLGVPLFYNVRWGDEFAGDIDSVTNFQGFTNAFASLFVVSTGEGWVQLMQATFYDDPGYSCQLDVNLDGMYTDERGCGNKAAGALFFTSFYLIHHYLLVSLLTVVVIDSYSAAYGSRTRMSSSESFVAMFAQAWLAHDPEFTGYVRIIYLRDIMIDSRILGEGATLREYVILAKVAAKYMHVEFRRLEGDFLQRTVRYISLESTFYALSRVVSPKSVLPPASLLIDSVKAAYTSAQAARSANADKKDPEGGDGNDDDKLKNADSGGDASKEAAKAAEADRKVPLYTDRDEWDWDQIENHAARVIQFAVLVYSEHMLLKARLAEEKFVEQMYKQKRLWDVVMSSSVDGSEHGLDGDDKNNSMSPEGMLGDHKEHVREGGEAAPARGVSPAGNNTIAAWRGNDVVGVSDKKPDKKEGGSDDDKDKSWMYEKIRLRCTRILMYLMIRWREKRRKLGRRVFARSEFVGSLTVRLLEAKNLPETVRAGKCDPFATMWCGGSSRGSSSSVDDDGKDKSRDKVGSIMGVDIPGIGIPGFSALKDGGGAKNRNHQGAYSRHDNKNVLSNNGRVDKSHVVLDTYDPVWNELFAFDIRHETDNLNVQVFDDDVIANRPVGECIVPVTTSLLAPDMDCTQWFALSQRRSNEGNIRLRMKTDLYKWVLDVGVVECRGLPEQYTSDKDSMNAYCVGVLGHHALATTPRANTFNPVFKEKLRFYVADLQDDLRLIMINNQPQSETGDVFVSQAKLPVASILSDQNIGVDVITGKRTVGTWDMTLWMPLTCEDAVRPWGQLHVTVVEGRGLPKMDAFGKVDPYCVVRMLTPDGPADARGLTTPVRLTTFTPKWDSKFALDVMTSDDKLRVEVYDHDWSGVSTLIGVIHAPLAAFMGRLEPFDAWYEVLPAENPSDQLAGLDGSLGQIRLILDLATDDVDYTGSFGYIHVTVHAEVLGSVPTLGDLGESVYICVRLVSTMRGF
jgi:hypothetical protein